MFILNWIKQYYDLKYELALRRQELIEPKVCESCETLKMALAIANQEKEKLLNRILEKPTVEVTQAQPPQITRPIAVPWKVRQQMLEKEDREKARIMRDAPKPQTTEEEKKEIAEFEKELDSATAAREETANQKG